MADRDSGAVSRGGSSSNGPNTSTNQKSTLGLVVEKAKSLLARAPSGTERLADDEVGFVKAREKEKRKEERKEKFENSGLKEQTVFGMKGAGGFGSL